jgi:hypothetical protein
VVTPRFTYLVTSYRNPEQLYRLVARLRSLSREAAVVVSHDRKSAPLDDARLEPLRATWWPTPTPVSWGDGSYLLSILAAYRRLDPGPEQWVTTLSGQDYPLRPLAEYEAHLATSGANALLEEPPDTPEEWNLRRRYVRRSHRVPAFATRGATGKLVRLVPGLTWAPMPHGLRPTIERPVLARPYRLRDVRRGNDLFAVDGTAVRALLTAPPRVLRHFVRTPTPSEGFAHTVLMNDPDIVVRPEMLHFARWQASAHPDDLGLDDLDEARASGRWFARKFTQDSPALDRLDELLDLP